jgi:hypothetical protein
MNYLEKRGGPGLPGLEQNYRRKVKGKDLYLSIIIDHLPHYVNRNWEPICEVVPGPGLGADSYFRAV